MPKYKIGDKVWFLENNKICENKVQAVFANDATYWYLVISQGENWNQMLEFNNWRNEDKVFLTKEALLASL